MQLLVFTTLAMVMFMVGFALDLGGTVSVLIFLLVLFIGATLRAWRPQVEWARGPSSQL
jgi:hypothetical protein